MIPTSRELKGAAKSRLRQRVFPMLVMAAVFIVASYLISYFSNELIGFNDWSRRINEILTSYFGELQAALNSPEELQAIFTRIYEAMPTYQEFVAGRSLAGPLLALLVSLMTLPLSAGYAHHILFESRNKDSSIGFLMHGFKITFKTVALGILTSLLSALGFVLFIVPGVVLMLRYSQAVYILMDDPDKGPIQCMRESGRLMRGHKWELFKLYFSFILWFLAADLVTGLIGAPLLNIYLTPYLNLTTACFYNELIHQEEPGPEPMEL